MNNETKNAELLPEEDREEHLPPWMPFTRVYSAEEKARLDALHEQWLEAPTVAAEMKIVRAMIEVTKDNARRKWVAENPFEPEENFHYPIGADLPMYQNDAQEK